MRLLPCYIACAALAIASAPGLADVAPLFWLGKPLTTLLALAHAARRGRAQPATRRALLAGLALSLLGDVALMAPGGFVAGLLAFLTAHLAYLVAFTRGGLRLAARPLPFAAYGVLAAGVLALLWPGVPPALRLPVLAYVVCLAAMAAQAAVRWEALRTAAAAGVALGGLLFLGSDTLLAVNRFHSPLPLASLWVLATYWAAQWLIASALPADRAAGERSAAAAAQTPAQG